MNRIIWLGVAAFLFGTTGTLAHGQDSVLAELYGQGVHSYFSGDYFNAQELLTSAIDQGSKDPRAYYFRGLTYYRIGRLNDGDADLKMGATLEANSTERIYPVSDSLQRVQGRVRMQIEKERQKARLVSRTKHNQAEQARFQQMEKSAAPKAAPAPGIVPPAPAAPDKTDPFANDLESKPEPATAKPPAVAAEPTPEAADPFGAATPETSTPPAATEKPAEAPADPFGAPAAPAAKDDASNPFSDDKPAAEAPPAEAPAAEKPAEKPADDPFG